jgi:hypothetical protein
MPILKSLTFTNLPDAWSPVPLLEIVMASTWTMRFPAATLQRDWDHAGAKCPP